jgi:hypothetical protein
VRHKDFDKAHTTIFICGWLRAKDLENHQSTECNYIDLELAENLCSFYRFPQKLSSKIEWVFRTVPIPFLNFFSFAFITKQA